MSVFTDVSVYAVHANEDSSLCTSLSTLESVCENIPLHTIVSRKVAYKSVKRAHDHAERYHGYFQFTAFTVFQRDRRKKSEYKYLWFLLHSR